MQISRLINQLIINSDDGVVVVDILRMTITMMITMMVCRQHDNNSCISSRWRSRFHRVRLCFSALQARRFFGFVSLLHNFSLLIMQNYSSVVFFAAVAR